MMMKLFSRASVFSILLFLPCVSFSQSNFFKKYSTSSTTCGYSAAISSAGQIRLIGSRFAPDETPFTAVIDSTGALSRLETVRTSRGEDNLYAVAADSNGGFFAAGTTVAANGSRDVLLYKVQSNGTISGKWQIASPDGQVIASMVRTSSGLILSGATVDNGNLDVLVMKINPANGRIIWKKSVGDEASEFGYSVAALNDGGIIVAGVRNDVPLLLKIDASGKLIWSRLIETLTYSPEGLPSVAIAGGSIYVAGSTGQGHHLRAQAIDEGIVVSKLNAAGSLQWSKHYHHPSGPLIVWNLAGSNAGEVFITGQIGLESPRALVFKIDAAGRAKWKRVLNETNSAAFASAVLADGSLITTGCVGVGVLDLFTWKVNGRNGNLDRPCGRLRSIGIGTDSISDRIVSYEPLVRNFTASSSRINVTKSTVATSDRDGCGNTD